MNDRDFSDNQLSGPIPNSSVTWLTTQLCVLEVNPSLGLVRVIGLGKCKGEVMMRIRVRIRGR